MDALATEEERGRLRLMERAVGLGLAVEPSRLLVVRQPVGDEVLLDLMHEARDLGLRLELVPAGLTYETAPGLRHQELVVGILNSVLANDRSGGPCGCHRFTDVAIRFAPMLVKRPDISIFCSRPAEEEGILSMIPEAVIEITSPGYEEKDLVQGPPLYLAAGVKDVLVLDRRQNIVHHWTESGHFTCASPSLFELGCGCRVTV